MPDGPRVETYGYDRIAAGSPKVVCGMSGCLEVRPGCQARLRRIGRGEAAVVLCDSGDESSTAHEIYMMPRSFPLGHEVTLTSLYMATFF
jgi:hypothetical protein